MKKVKKLSEHPVEDYNVNLLDGGLYGNIARSDGYKCHHFISSHFCKHHKYCISQYTSPAVLLPKESHELTSSHPKLGLMRRYLKWGRIFYRGRGITWHYSTRNDEPNSLNKKNTPQKTL